MQSLWLKLNQKWWGLKGSRIVRQMDLWVVSMNEMKTIVIDNLIHMIVGDSIGM